MTPASPAEAEGPNANLIGAKATSMGTVHGAERVAEFLARGSRMVDALDATTVWLDGAPAGRIEFDGELGAAVSVDVEEGRITRI